MTTKRKTSPIIIDLDLPPDQVPRWKPPSLSELSPKGIEQLAKLMATEILRQPVFLAVAPPGEAERLKAIGDEARAVVADEFDAAVKRRKGRRTKS